MSNLDDLYYEQQRRAWQKRWKRKKLQLDKENNKNNNE
jgi:hypothetical protein